MNLKKMVPTVLLAAIVGGCTSLLEVTPVDEISDEIAIVDEASARAALMGAYAALEAGSYYGGSYLMWTETLTDNVEHTGTFEGYADADALVLRPDMSTIPGMWNAMYEAVNAANVVLQKIPEIDGLDAGVANELLGQAYGLRALHYFNLVRSWGGVPLVLSPPASLEEAAQVTRATEAAVYAQIEADLAQAETLLSGVDHSDRTLVTPGFAWALRAKAALYQEDWATAEAEARRLVASGDYALAPVCSELFTDEGDATGEDVFRVVFTATQYNNLGYYYQYAGRFEIGATSATYDLYPTGDHRFVHNFDGVRSDGIEVVKFPTTLGTEDLHAIRYADVVLILAEALARQGGATKLSEAIDWVNLVRERADLAPLTYGVGLSTQTEVLDAIWLERRLELAFEGEYWFDLVRTGRAAAVLGPDFDAHEGLWPIPVSELDVSPNIAQNPGY